MFFAPPSNPALRLCTPIPLAGTPNIEVRHALDTAAWLWHPGLPPGQTAFLLFRLPFVSDGAPLRLQLSADMRYELALDGELLARGPDSSDPAHWDFNTLELTPAPGPHRLEVFVWWLPASEKLAGRMSHRGGFALAALDHSKEHFHTGFAPWQVAELHGWSSTGSLTWTYHVIGPGSTIDLAAFDPDRAVWTAPSVVREALNENVFGLKSGGWSLEPSGLPAQRSDLHRSATIRSVHGEWLADDARFPADSPLATAPWRDLWIGASPLTLSAHSSHTVLVDFDDYLCGYPLIEFSGGAGSELSWLWAEALYENTERHKGHRDAVAGKFFEGFGDRFIFGGSGRRHIRSHWWRAGRYVLLRIRVATEPLVVHSLAVERTGFPAVPRASFDSSLPALAPTLDLCQRGLFASMNDVYVDSPFYEQMMYAGDTRLEMLMTYIVSGDDRLPRRGIELIAGSRDAFGLTAMRYPSHERQESATFSLFWIWMLHDFAFWRDDRSWVASQIASVRGILDTLVRYETADGLLSRPPGWLFLDWVPEWHMGWPPSAREGVSALVNFQYLHTLQKAADLEAYAGDPFLADRHRERAARLATALESHFWDAGRNLFADDSTRRHWSQHAQIFAVLTGLRPPDPSAAWADPAQPANDLVRVTIYFQHYLFEALHRMGRGDWLLRRLEYWEELVALGLKAPLEQPEPSRSDCHAWGSHPLIHVHASLAGIRPAAPGFSHVSIAPQPGSLTWLESKLPHPRGVIHLRAKFSGTSGSAEIELPPDTTGTFSWNGSEIPLHPGTQNIIYA